MLISLKISLIFHLGFAPGAGIVKEMARPLEKNDSYRMRMYSPFLNVVTWPRAWSVSVAGTEISFQLPSLWRLFSSYVDMSRLRTKPTKWLCAQRKFRSESSLCAQWVAKGPSFLHADSEYSDQTGRMPSESSLCAQWIAKDPSFLHTDSEYSDQTGRMPSESSLFAQWIAKNPSFLHADSEYSDQTGRMPRLIWVFAGSTCHFVGFVMRRLIFFLAAMWQHSKNSKC